MPENVLITGFPGVGKTTLIKKLSETMETLHTVGFFTTEIRIGGVRKGFELISLDGEKACLSHVDIKGPYRVGKYGVDVAEFESFLDGIAWQRPEVRAVIVDEIGKMECLSRKFREFIVAVYREPAAHPGGV